MMLVNMVYQLYIFAMVKQILPIDQQYIILFYNIERKIKFLKNIFIEIYFQKYFLVYTLLHPYSDDVS